MTKVDLEIIPLMMQGKLRKHLATYQADFYQYAENFTDDLVFQLRALVLGERQKTITIKGTPRSWWQHFKRDCMPQWFVKRFPVMNLPDRTIEATVWYPDLQLSVPQKHGRVVLYFNDPL
jgi:hypothetical protein